MNEQVLTRISPFLMAIWWALIATLLQGFLILLVGHLAGAAFSDAIASNFILLAANFGVIQVFRSYQAKRPNYFYRFLAITALAFACTFLSRVFVETKNLTDGGYKAFFKQTEAERYIFAFATLGFFSFVATRNYRSRETEEGRKRESGIEQLYRDAELASLRQQLHPHFLFNSLNSISALIATRPEEARKMIQQLSEFLRGTVRKDDKQLVSLEEELHLLNLYMEIEKVRFSHRLSTPVDAAAESLPMKLPPLLLQPVVENAIKFGLYDTTEAVTITITTHAENGMLVIEVKNPFDPETAQPRQGTGFGLESIRKRLFLLYGRNDLLAVEQEGAIFRTLLKIPQSHV